MEFSTPFVSIRSILSTMGLKNTRIYIINGITMLITFFICRIFMWPYVFYWYSEVINRPFVQVSRSIVFFLDMRWKPVSCNLFSKQKCDIEMNPRTRRSPRIMTHCKYCSIEFQSWMCIKWFVILRLICIFCVISSKQFLFLILILIEILLHLLEVYMFNEIEMYNFTNVKFELVFIDIDARLLLDKFSSKKA